MLSQTSVMPSYDGQKRMMFLGLMALTVAAMFGVLQQKDSEPTHKEQFDVVSAMVTGLAFAPLSGGSGMDVPDGGGRSNTLANVVGAVALRPSIPKIKDTAEKCKVFLRRIKTVVMGKVIDAYDVTETR